MKKSKIFTLLLFLPCMMFGNPSIHIIGDSHAWEFRGIPGCIEHYLGAITMHRMGRDALHATHLGIHSGDVVVCAFGEIDVRCHIGKQRDLKGRDLNEIILTLATNYLHQMVQSFPNTTLIVYSVTPPSDIINNPAFPMYGSLEDRIHITKLLNQTLQRLCQACEVHFLDVYDDYADEHGQLRPDLSDYNVHIHSGCNGAIRNKLFEILEKQK